MPSNESLRKQCAKLCLDTIIHQSITEVARSPGVQQAFLRLLITSGNPTISAINSAATTFTMPASDVAITATYK